MRQKKNLHDLIENKYIYHWNKKKKKTFRQRNGLGEHIGNYIKLRFIEYFKLILHFINQNEIFVL